MMPLFSHSHRIALATLVFVLLSGLASACRFTPGQDRAIVENPTPTASSLAVPSATIAATPLVAPTEQAPAIEPPIPTPAPARFFDNQRLTYEPDFYVPQMQAWLDAQPGPLKSMTFAIGDRRHTFAESLISQTSYYSMNPKVVLALIELQSGLVSNPQPSAEQIAWALGYHGEDERRRGTQAQVRWAIRQALYAKRDFEQRSELSFADQTTQPPAADSTLSEYVLSRILAPTTTLDRLPGLLEQFRETYTRLFGDPRTPPIGWPGPSTPFLRWPMERGAPVTSFFDHNGPFLTRQPGAPILTYWGRDETDAAFAYDGHDGWDYAMAPPDVALAAADGEVVFAGNADDNCAARAVILDHRNGYRTMYWHLARVFVEIGEQVSSGDALGVIGESGCAKGPHLHLGVQFLGRDIDPYGWCATTPDPWAVHPAGGESRWLWADRPTPCGAPPLGSVVVDTDSPGFRKTGSGWNLITPGYDGSALAIVSLLRPPPPPTPTPTPDPLATATPELQPTPEPTLEPTATPGTPEPTAVPATPTPIPVPATAEWTARVPVTGRYRVLAYIPYALSGFDDARDVRYQVRSLQGQTEAVVNQFVSANEWADLGTYTFSANSDAVVRINNQTESANRTVWADAIIWLPVEATSTQSSE